MTIAVQIVTIFVQIVTIFVQIVTILVQSDHYLLAKIVTIYKQIKVTKSHYSGR